MGWTTDSWKKKLQKRIAEKSRSKRVYKDPKYPKQTLEESLESNDGYDYYSDKMMGNEK